MGKRKQNKEVSKVVEDKVDVVLSDSDDEAPEQITFSESKEKQLQHEQNLKSIKQKKKKKKKSTKKTVEQDNEEDVIQPISQATLEQLKDEDINEDELDEDEESDKKVVMSLDKVKKPNKTKIFNGVQAQKVESGAYYLLPDIEPSTNTLNFLNETLFLNRTGNRKRTLYL